MIWHDILIDRHLDEAEIARTLGIAIGVEPRTILVHRDADSFPDPAGYRAVAVATDLGGDYPLLLSVYTFLDGVDPPSPTDAARRLAAASGAACLISDDGDNPYTMLRVSPTGLLESVLIDPARLDDHGDYRVTEPARAPRGAMA